MKKILLSILILASPVLAEETQEYRAVILCTSKQQASIFGRVETPCDNEKKVAELLEESLLVGYSKLFPKQLAKARRETARALKTYTCAEYYLPQ